MKRLDSTTKVGIYFTAFFLGVGLIGGIGGHRPEIIGVAIAKIMFLWIILGAGKLLLWIVESRRKASRARQSNRIVYPPPLPRDWTG